MTFDNFPEVDFRHAFTNRPSIEIVRTLIGPNRQLRKISIGETKPDKYHLFDNTDDRFLLMYVRGQNVNIRGRGDLITLLVASDLIETNERLFREFSEKSGVELWKTLVDVPYLNSEEYVESMVFALYQLGASYSALRRNLV